MHNLLVVMTLKKTITYFFICVIVVDVGENQIVDGFFFHLVYKSHSSPNFVMSS